MEISTETAEIIFILLFVISELIGMSKCESGGILNMFYILFVRKTPPLQVLRERGTMTVGETKTESVLKDVLVEKQEISRNPF